MYGYNTAHYLTYNAEHNAEHNAQHNAQHSVALRDPVRGKDQIDE